MKVAKIYVGGESEMSRDLLKDQTEDAIRAAESAYRYGYVPGCNFTIVNSCDWMLNTCELSDLEKSIVRCIKGAFKYVYAEVLRNAFTDICVAKDAILNDTDAVIRGMQSFGVQTSPEILADLLEQLKADEAFCSAIENYHEVELATLLVELSYKRQDVFDLDIMDFSDNVINSVKTDIEILKATSDLLSILVVGNQVLIASWNHSHIRNN
jgi:chaperonin GroEL (HSP60 family)